MSDDSIFDFVISHPDISIKIDSDEEYIFIHITGQKDESIEIGKVINRKESLPNQLENMYKTLMRLA